jgi:hypothetical protein
MVGGGLLAVMTMRLETVGIGSVYSFEYIRQQANAFKFQAPHAGFAES